MDLNIVVLAGHLAADPERRTFSSGSRLLRLLVAIRQSEPRRRVDVLPVSLWNPPPELWDADLMVGDRAWVAGQVQRRFWAAEEGRRSRLELIAQQVQVRAGEEESASDQEGRGSSIEQGDLGVP